MKIQRTYHTSNALQCIVQYNHTKYEFIYWKKEYIIDVRIGRLYIENYCVRLRKNISYKRMIYFIKNYLYS